MVPTTRLHGYEAPAPRFGEFRQAVRRYRPTNLLPFLAREAAKQPPTSEQTAWRHTPPWEFAAIGRESILHGNEFRSASVDARGLRRIFNLFNTMYEDDPDGVDVHRLMTGLFYEQFPYSISIKEEINRSYLMMADLRLPGPGLQSEDWPAVLGTSLDEAIRATFLLWVGAGINHGTYDPGWLRQPNFADVNAIIPADVTEATARRLTGTVENVKRDARDVENQVGRLPLHLAQYAYNSLTRRPFVDLGHNVRYAPQYQLIIQSAMPDSLNYAGVRHGGNGA